MTKSQAKHYSLYFSINLAKDGSFTHEQDFKKVDKAAENLGFYCMLSTAELDSTEVLVKYHAKDVIEKAFDDIKNYIHMKKLRAHSSETTEGKLFCAFIALIVASEIGTKLNELMWKKGWSKEAVILELEKIRAVTSGYGKRLVAPVTKTHRTIFEVFGLTDEHLKTYVAE
jgi:transposase